MHRRAMHTYCNASPCTRCAGKKLSAALRRAADGAADGAPVPCLYWAAGTCVRACVRGHMRMHGQHGAACSRAHWRGMHVDYAHVLACVPRGCHSTVTHAVLA